MSYLCVRIFGTRLVSLGTSFGIEIYSIMLHVRACGNGIPTLDLVSLLILNVCCFFFRTCWSWAWSIDRHAASWLRNFIRKWCWALVGPCSSDALYQQCFPYSHSTCVQHTRLMYKPGTRSRSSRCRKTLPSTIIIVWSRFLCNAAHCTNLTFVPKLAITCSLWSLKLVLLHDFERFDPFSSHLLFIRILIFSCNIYFIVIRPIFGFIFCFVLGFLFCALWRCLHSVAYLSSCKS